VEALKASREEVSLVKRLLIKADVAYSKALAQLYSGMAIVESQDPPAVQSAVLKRSSPKFKSAIQLLELSHAHASSGLKQGSSLSGGGVFSTRLQKTIAAIGVLRTGLAKILSLVGKGQAPMTRDCLALALAMKDLQEITIEKTRLRAREARGGAARG
jgi:hypothetical protein